MITVKNVSKRYGSQQVLSGFSVDFADGGIYCIMGESGAGKTTLLNLLLGLEPPDTGSIQGNHVKFGVVFQENRLCEELDADRNIRLVTGNRFSQKQIDENLKQIGIMDCSGKKIKEFSGGMKRRVCIVRAILSDSSILLLDEPFKGLDEQNRLLVIRYLKEQRKSRTLIFITHDKRDIADLDANCITIEAPEVSLC